MKDFGSKELAGKTVDFKFRVCEVKRRELAELDDDFARDLGEFDDLAALRERVREDLQARKDHEEEHAAKQAVLERVMVDNPVVLPDVLVQREIRGRLEEVVRGMMMRGMDPEKTEVDWEELRKGQEEPARRMVHAGLILDAVAGPDPVVGHDLDHPSDVGGPGDITLTTRTVTTRTVTDHHGAEPLRLQRTVRVGGGTHRHHRVERQGHRQHESGVVVGVLTDEVDTTGCPDDEVGLSPRRPMRCERSRAGRVSRHRWSPRRRPTGFR